MKNVSWRQWIRTELSLYFRTLFNSGIYSHKPARPANIIIADRQLGDPNRQLDSQLRAAE
jgi:hypothetical protein